MSNLGEGIRDNVIADVVMNMYKKEYSLEQIADIVEKSVEEVEVVVKKRKNKVILDDFDGFNQKEGLIPRSLLRNKLFEDVKEVIY